VADPVRGTVEAVEDGPEYDLDFREHPERYRSTDGEEGAFKIEPYKSELLPLWTIADLEGAEEAAAALHEQYREYREREDFVGMDLARKYLQMGWTRALRYAKYPGGRKYDDDGTEREPQEWYDEEKYRVSQVYRERLDAVREDTEYERLRERHRERYGGGERRTEG
jgi:hypothetical protein